MVKTKSLEKTIVYLYKPCMQKINYISYRTRESKSEIIRNLINTENTLDQLFKEIVVKYGNNIQIDEY